MPFTPFHFGPNLVIALPLRKHLDVVSFVFASVAVDVEPLLVLFFDLDYPLHGYCHTFLVGIGVGSFWGVLLFQFRTQAAWVLKKVYLGYETTLLKSVLSGILGVWFHVLVDAPIYSDIRPFFPWMKNPLYGLYGYEVASLVGLVMLIGVGLLTFKHLRKTKKP